MEASPQHPTTVSPGLGGRSAFLIADILGLTGPESTAAASNNNNNNSSSGKCSFLSSNNDLQSPTSSEESTSLELCHRLLSNCKLGSSSNNRIANEKDNKQTDGFGGSVRSSSSQAAIVCRLRPTTATGTEAATANTRPILHKPKLDTTVVTVSGVLGETTEKRIGVVQAQQRCKSGHSDVDNSCRSAADSRVSTGRGKSGVMLTSCHHNGEAYSSTTGTNGGGALGPISAPLLLTSQAPGFGAPSTFGHPPPGWRLIKDINDRYYVAPEMLIYSVHSFNKIQSHSCAVPAGANSAGSSRLSCDRFPTTAQPLSHDTDQSTNHEPAASTAVPLTNQHHPTPSRIDTATQTEPQPGLCDSCYGRQHTLSATAAVQSFPVQREPPPTTVVPLQVTASTQECNGPGATVGTVSSLQSLLDAAQLVQLQDQVESLECTANRLRSKLYASASPRLLCNSVDNLDSQWDIEQPSDPAPMSASCFGDLLKFGSADAKRLQQFSELQERIQEVRRQLNRLNREHKRYQHRPAPTRRAPRSSGPSSLSPTRDALSLLSLCATELRDRQTRLPSTSPDSLPMHLQHTVDSTHLVPKPIASGTTRKQAVTPGAMTSNGYRSGPVAMTITTSAPATQSLVFTSAASRDRDRSSKHDVTVDTSSSRNRWEPVVSPALSLPGNKRRLSIESNNQARPAKRKRHTTGNRMDHACKPTTPPPMAPGFDEAPTLALPDWQSGPPPTLYRSELSFSNGPAAAHVACSGGLVRSHCNIKREKSEPEETTYHLTCLANASADSSNPMLGAPCPSNQSSHSGEDLRPPTPDVRKSDLDYNDLSDGLRILLIQDTHLRAGTLTGAASQSPATSLGNGEHGTNLASPMLPSSGSMQMASPGTAASTSQLYRIRLDGERRHQDVVLPGWLVLQQAVMEVLPSSRRHLPAGTRVCAYWSDQLADNLYPGTVVDPEDDELLAANHVAIDFDDGDHNQVIISRIRMLPDHFTNLAEMLNLTGAGGVRPVGTMHPGGSLKSVPCGFGVFSCSGEMNPNATAAVTSPITVKTTVATPSSVWVCKTSPATPSSHTTYRQHQRHPSGVTDITTVTTATTQSTNLSPQLTWTEEGGLRVAQRGRSTPASTAASGSSSKKKKTQLTTAAELIRQRQRSRQQGGSIRKQEDSAKHRGSASPGTGSRIQVRWKFKGKCIRRRSGHEYYREVMRDVDRHVIRLGDSVEFSSGRADRTYLGLIRDIYRDLATGDMVTAATWYYYPSEAGGEGARASHLQGAVFITDHCDVNEIRCIIRRVLVAPDYATFHALPPLLAPNPPSNQGEDDDSDGSSSSSSSSSDSTGISDSSTSSEEDTRPMYFIVGRYDPKADRVTEWDPEVAKLLAGET